MDWVKDFYTKQREMYRSADYSSTLTPNSLPEIATLMAASVDRMSGPGNKRILDLGCGGGLEACALAISGIPWSASTSSTRALRALVASRPTFPTGG